MEGTLQVHTKKRIAMYLQPKGICIELAELPEAVLLIPGAFIEVYILKASHSGLSFEVQLM